MKKVKSTKWLCLLKNISIELIWIKEFLNKLEIKFS